MTSRIYPCLLLQLCVLFLSSVCLGHRHVEPEWKQVLKDFPKWTGFYKIYQAQYTCTLRVHSVQSGRDGTAMLTFKDRDTEMDVTALSYDDVTIIIEMESMHKASTRFPGNLGFKVEGTMKKIEGIWTYSGEITEPADKGFNTFRIRAQEFSDVSITEKKSSSLTLGLAVGIPVTLAVMVTVTGVLMLIWAVRKGYLRHVPRSFTTFRNSPECDVTLENGRAAMHM